MVKSKKVVLPKLMKGSFYFYDIEEMPKLNVRELRDDYDGHQLDRGNIIPNKHFENEIVIFDLPEDIDSFGASFRGFLYKDGKILGKLTWNMDNMIREVEDISGHYSKTARKLAAHGQRRLQNGGIDYFYFEMKK